MRLRAALATLVALASRRRELEAAGELAYPTDWDAFQRVQWQRDDTLDPVARLAAQMRVLEWGHYFGAPTLIPHAISKRWIIAPWRWNLFLTERYDRHYAVAAPDPKGTFTFYIARCI